MNRMNKILICFLLAIPALTISSVIKAHSEEPISSDFEHLNSENLSSLDSEISMQNHKFIQNQPQNTVIITFGMSTIKKNKGIAKQNATNDALKEAVEQSITRMMKSDEITPNLKLIYEAANNHAEQFIITYRIVGELVQKDKSIVAVESLISKEALERFFRQKGVINGEIKNEEKASGLKTIKATIEGDDYLSSFIMLRKTLNSMKGIKDVHARDLSSDEATVTILFDGGGKHLAEQLMETSFDDFGLQLSDITDESLNIRFVPKTYGAPIEKTDMEGAYISE